MKPKNVTCGTMRHMQLSHARQMDQPFFSNSVSMHNQACDHMSPMSMHALESKHVSPMIMHGNQTT